jgi:L-ectoine synthase
MIVRSLKNVIGTERDIEPESHNWNSRRLLLREDGMGFSMHDTIVYAGTETLICYRHHLEAVYCIDGEGEIEDVDNGEIHHIEPGILYALNGHERHYLRASSDMRLICVFNPALVGDEVHDQDGSYPLLNDVGDQSAE